jgi:hypothetical protein
VTTPGPQAGLHGRPTSLELLDAVVGFLRDQLPPHVDGSFHHQVRIAVHALEMVARELELGPGQLESHRARLRAFGVADDAELAARIRAGDFDDRADLVEALRADSRDRLLVANPRWLPPEGTLG